MLILGDVPPLPPGPRYRRATIWRQIPRTRLRKHVHSGPRRRRGFQTGSTDIIAWFDEKKQESGRGMWTYSSHWRRYLFKNLEHTLCVTHKWIPLLYFGCRIKRDTKRKLYRCLSNFILYKPKYVFPKWHRSYDDFKKNCNLFNTFVTLI